MASAVLGSVGAYAGSFAGGTFGWTAATWSQIGWTAGVLTANYLFAPEGPDLVSEGPRLDDLKVSSSTFGADIPQVFGAYRIAGNIIWALPLLETSHEEQEEEGKGGGGGTSETRTWYTYQATFAVALCQGPITGIRKIWFGSVLVYDDGNSSIYDSITVYTGSSTQTPNWIMEADKPDTPAYRNIAYVVFDSIELESYGNLIPNVTCEVIKNGSTYSKYDYESPLPYDIVRQYVPPRTYGYGSGFIPDIDIDGNKEFVYFPLVENNQFNEGPLIYLVKVDANLNYIDTKILSFGATTNIGISSIICSDNGKFIFSVHSNSSFSTIVYTDNGASSFNQSYLPQPPEYMGVPSAVLYSNDRIFLYDSENVATVDPPVYVYNEGGCIPGSCNVLSEWISSDNMAGMDAKKLYCSSNMIFVVSNVTHTGATENVIKVWSTETPNTLLYEFTLPKLYTDGSQYVVQLYYTNWILYVSSFYGADEFEPFYGIDIRTGAVVEQYNLEMPGPNVGLATTRMVVENGKVYLYGIGDIVIASLTKISNDGIDVRTICAELSYDCGLSSSDLDYSEGVDAVSGYVVTSNMSARAAIEPVLAAYDYIMIENDHKIKLKKLQSVSILDIPQEDLGANSDNNIEYNIKQEIDSLKKLTIRFANNQSDYQTGVQSMIKIGTQAKDERTIELPLALTDNQAKRLVEKYLYNNWVTRQSYSFKLQFTYNNLIVGDVVTVNFDNYIKDVRLTEITINSDNTIQCKAIANDYDIYNSNAEADSTSGNTAPLKTLPSLTKLVLANTPSLSNYYIDKEGFYLAANGFNDSWNGCDVLSKQSEYDDLTTDTTIVTGSVVGTVNKVLLDGPTHTWDLVNTIDVAIAYGEILSSTLEGVLSGDNYALVGDEIVQFVNATLSDNVYSLDTLLRGRRGTERRTDSHVFGEDFVLLGPLNFINKQINRNDIYATTSFGRDSISLYGNFLYNGENLKPFNPSYLNYTRTLATNVEVAWMRKSRYISGKMNTRPLGESTEEYEIDIYQADVFKNTHTATSESFDYTDVLAAADGVILGGITTFEIFQLSSIYGRGYSSEITTTPYDDGTFETYIKNLNPQVYWELGESSGNAIDSGINGYTGTVGALATQGNTSILPGGKTNYYFSRNSTSNVKNSTAGTMDYSTYSYCAFIKLRAGDSAGFPIFKGIGASSNYEIGLYNGVASGADVLTSVAAYHKESALSVKSAPFAGGQLLDVWNHYVVTYDGDTITCYLNGVPRVRSGIVPPINLGTEFNLNSGSGFSECEVSEVGFFKGTLNQENVDKMLELYPLHTYNAGAYKAYAESLSPANYWMLADETLIAVDSVGTEDGTHAIADNSNTRLIVGDNTVGHWYYFSTSYDYSTDLNTSLRFNRTDAFSLAFQVVLVRPNNAGYTTDLRYILAAWNGSSGLYVSVNKTGNITFRMTNTATTNDLLLVTNNGFSSDTVHQVVITYDGTGTSAGTNLYINGTLIPHTATYDNLVSNPIYTSNTYIGSRSNVVSTPNKLWGYVGHLLSYGYVLTSTEVSNLHNVSIGSP